MMMRVAGKELAGWIIVACWALGAARASAEPPTFDVSSVEGRYGFLLDGIVALEGNDAGKIRVLGVLTFDGAGGVSGRRLVKQALSRDWRDATEAFSGTYEIEPDGIGLMELTVETLSEEGEIVGTLDGQEPAQVMHFTVTGGGQELQLLTRLQSLFVPSRKPLLILS